MVEAANATRPSSGLRNPLLWGTAALALSFTGGSFTGGTAFAQTVSPVTVTPSTLAPEQNNTGYRLEIPEAGALQAPAGAEKMAVTLTDVQVAGGFAEVAAQTDAVVAGLRNRRVSLAEIYAAASQIEAIHARAGYVLARVSVPPQQLADGGALKIVVTDGFIESVDVTALPARVQSAVKARTAMLAGKRHVTIAQIEQPLVIASDVPGLVLRSTLMRGTVPGGTRLVLEGRQRLLTGSLGVDNQLDPSLGRWGINLQLALNSAFGLGEQVYGFVSSNYDLSRLFDRNPPERVLGGGIILPLGDGRFSLNPEATFARTAPAPATGTPQTVGTLRRLTMRANDILLRTRRSQAALNLTIEQIDETNAVPDFAVQISHDRYIAARFGGSASTATDAGASYGAAVQFSQGLGDLGAITLADAVAANVPFSRQGSSTRFSKLTAGGRASWTMGDTVGLSLQARGQATFGKPVFRAEQIALEGVDGLSAYVGGRTALDTGAVVRGELSANVKVPTTATLLSGLTPYVFGAFGSGRLERPTALEPGTISAFNVGGGVRATAFGRIGIAVEYARGIADLPGLDKVDRVNVSAGWRF